MNTLAMLMQALCIYLTNVFAMLLAMMINFHINIQPFDGRKSFESSKHFCKRQTKLQQPTTAANV
ncbi:hypothetical protein DERF_008134 [Dermatophagoides farinae]|uniref:Uncharacterized protein n=1 Tax=Dermatophagoides farinae TaxID=6954 RepID=A0A922HZP3_DERFA|nr:hypothetical protein DERF_008134 [Dermatophagoides farinae]